MSNFHVGQRVVCVDAKNNPGREWTFDAPTVGAVYTIRRVLDGKLDLHEIRNRPGLFYLTRRFRPVIERSTDISIFQQLLNPSPVLAKEPV